MDLYDLIVNNFSRYILYYPSYFSMYTFLQNIYRYEFIIPGVSQNVSEMWMEYRWITDVYQCLKMYRF